MPAAKMLRLGSSDSQSEASASLMFVGNNSNAAASPEEAPSAAPTVKEPLKTALQNLFEVNAWNKLYISSIELCMIVFRYS